MKKKQESKHEKTITSHEKAFKAAERKTRLQLSQVVSHCSDSLHMVAELLILKFCMLTEPSLAQWSHSIGHCYLDIHFNFLKSVVINVNDI